MNCLELQASLVEVEDGSSREQSAHLKTCPSCALLVREFKLIIASAEELREADDPSPRVWNSIEIALRQEGLIRPQGARKVVPSFSAHWGWSRWLVPAAAMLLLGVGIYERRGAMQNPQDQAAVVTPAPNSNVGDLNGDLNDNDLLAEVADNSPAMRTAYTDNLRRVNDYIRDAQTVVNENPNDDDARRALMEAYQQKSMLFEMAMERTQP
jgi:hypothetical protein